MLRHFEKLKTPLKSVFTYPSLETQRRRFSNLGWGHADVASLWQIWSDDQFISPRERRALDQVEPFDEWEEFALFASHYCVVIAKTTTVGTDSIRSEGVTSLGPMISVATTPIHFDGYERSRGQRRFGAPMAFKNNVGQRLLANTFGLGTNSRLRSYDLYGQSGMLHNVEGHHPGPPGRMCHTITDLGSHGNLLSGGRASPASAFQDCWLFNKDTHVWSRLEDLPVPLYRHAVTRLGRSNMALLIGGKTGSSSIFSGCLVYRPNSGWIECKILGFEYRPVFGASLVSSSNVFVGPNDESPNTDVQFGGTLAGGLLDDGTISKRLLHWELSLPANDGLPVISLKPLQSRQITTRPHEDGSRATDTDVLVNRFGASLFPYDDNRIVVVGGIVYGDILPKECEILVISASEPEYKILAAHQPNTPQDSPTIPRPLLVGVSVFMAKDGSLVIMGGGATCFSMGTCWNNGCYSITNFLANVDNGIRNPPTLSSRWPFTQVCEVTEKLPSSTLALTDPRNEVHAATVNIPRIRVTTRNSFLEVMKRGKPIIIEGAGLGTCVQTWTPEYLTHRVGHERKVRISLSVGLYKLGFIC